MFSNLNTVNKYYASVYRDPDYSVHDVLCFARPYCANTSIHTNDHMRLTLYEVEKLLYKIKPSSPGLDNIPRWLIHNCSHEIANAVAHILNASFSCGVVPCQWRQAVVTPIPKVPKPQSLSDYRLISVTLLLSRVAEKLVVSRWLLPSIPVTIVQD